MTDDATGDGPRRGGFASGAWGSVGPAAPAAGAPLAAARFERRGLIGVGGMARVHLAWDHHLQREVALKTPHGAVGAARLAREAALTARLEHPGIAAVYDVGQDGDGQPWFAMRRVDGRSLRVALREAEAGDLWRRAYDLCAVMAYAHDAGVAHLDLKPENVMVGAYGGVVVLDWGLARALDDPDDRPPAGAHGTPGYMSPEAALGAAPSRAQDVWSLGAILHELLAGAPPFGAESPERRLARVVAGELPETLGPPELVAIVRRALAPDPADRYPDAGALAADLGAWLDGRRVAAHTYTRGELLRRALRAYRRPLAVVAALTVVAAAGAGWSVQRIVAARDRAQAADARARAGLQRLMVLQAASAEARGDRPRAELWAAHAIARAQAAGEAPDPTAWSPLLRWAAQARPAPLGILATPQCGRRAASTPGALICEQGGALHGLDAATGVPRWRLAIERPRWAVAADAPVVVLADATHIGVIDALSGRVRGSAPAALRGGRGVVVAPDGSWAVVTGRAPLAVRVESLRVKPLSPCPHNALDAALRDGRALFACAAGTLVLTDLRTGLSGGGLAAPFDDAEHPLSRLVWLDDDHALLVVGGRRLLRMHLGTGDVRLLRTLADRVTHLAARGARVLIGTRDGRAEVLDADTGNVLGRLPTGVRGGVALGAGVATLVGTRVERWRIDALGPPVELRTPVGVMPARVSPDGGWIAAAAVDGSLRVWSTADGRGRALRWRAGAAAVKGVDFAPDGRTLAVAAMGADADRLYAVDGWQDRGPLVPGGRPARRVVHVGGGQVVARFGGGVDHVERPNTVPAPLPLRGVDDVARPADAAFALLLDRADDVWQLDGDGAAPARLAQVPDAAQLAVDPAGRRWAAAWDNGVALFERPARERGRLHSPTVITDVALGAEHLILGHLDGTVAVYRLDAAGAPGELVARLAAHDDRVGSVELALDGATLWTSGWDRRVRRWDLRPLARPGAALVAEVEAAWGRTLADALAEVAQGQTRP